MGYLCSDSTQGVELVPLGQGPLQPLAFGEVLLKLFSRLSQLSCALGNKLLKVVTVFPQFLFSGLKFGPGAQSQDSICEVICQPGQQLNLLFVKGIRLNCIDV